MNQKLPKVYAVPINKKIANNKEVFTSSESNYERSSVSRKDIENIFKSKNHVYKTKLLITVGGIEKMVEVVGINNNNLLTLSGDVINIGDITAIKKV